MANALVPADTDNPLVLHGLIRKRSEIAGLIKQHRSETTRLKSDLAHIDAAIRIFDPRLNVGAIQPKPTCVLYRARNGQVTGAVFDVLREANGPMTPPEIAMRLMTYRGLDTNDADLVKLMIDRLRPCLRDQRGRGLLRSAVQESGLLGWELVRR